MCEILQNTDPNEEAPYASKLFLSFTLSLKVLYWDYEA